MGVAMVLAGCDAKATKAPKQISPEATPSTPASLEDLARTDHVALLERCLEHYDRNYEAYTCTFRKQERIEGRLKPEQKVEIRFREEPFSVAMKWVENAPAADRLLFVQGAYEDKMLLRPNIVLLRGMTVRKDPHAPDVMKQTLRPVTRFGFRNALVHLLGVYREAKEEADLEMRFGGYAEVDSRPTLLIERHLPADKGYPAPVTQIYIDVKYLVPVGIRALESDGALQANYLYENVQFNPDLTAEDFTPASLDMASVAQE
jgi:hypothetical protein